MPKTIVYIKTFICPNGAGHAHQPEVCRFHRAFDNLPEDGLCSDCGLLLEKAVLLEDKMCKTIMGAEDIESEIEQRTEATYRSTRLAELDAQVESGDADGEFPTERAREHWRTNQQTAIEQDITDLKAQPESNLGGPTFRASGYFLVTDKQILNYRARRLDDIARAIVEAKKGEDN